MKKLFIASVLLVLPVACRTGSWMSSSFPWRHFPADQEANSVKLRASVPYRGDVLIVQRPHPFDLRKGPQKIKQQIMIRGEFDGMAGVMSFRDEFWVFAYPVSVEHRDGDEQGLRIVIKEDSPSNRVWFFEYHYNVQEKRLIRTRAEGDFEANSESCVTQQPSHDSG